MYLPQHFEETNVGVLHDLIRAHPLGSLVVMTSQGLDANHIPFLVQPEPLPFGSLRGHVARGNAVWRDAAAGAEALVIFQGAEAYISPSLYPSKQEHGKVVPTWNYAVVHAHGRIRAIDDPAWLRGHVDELVGRHEAGRPMPWKTSDAPSDFVDKLLHAIVGIEIRIDRLVGKWKVSQNRPPADREGVVEGLTQDGSAAAAAMADLVRRFNQ